MKPYLLRLEAVNFHWSCYDTQDISTIRGGSLLLSNAPEFVWERYRNVKNSLPPLVEMVAAGASQAVFRFLAETDAQAEQVRGRIEQLLAEDNNLKHATFVVDVVAGVPEDEQAKEEDRQAAEADCLKQLRAGNRWRQFQQPTLAVPEPLTPGQIQKSMEKYQAADPQPRHPMPENGRFCEVDMVRPAIHVSRRGTDAEWISESVYRRREYGKTKRQEFYKQEAGEAADGLQFTYDLKQLSARRVTERPDPTDPKDRLHHTERPDPTDPKDRLHHKMAVIYLDGNKQGEMAAEFGTKKLGEFRHYLQVKHRDFLKDLLRIIQEEKTANRHLCKAGNDWIWKRQDEDDCEQELVRLETLLWGGDDLVLVTPAWQGWPTVQLFFQHVTGEIGGRWEFDGHNLTCSAGIVFCPHKAPILRIRRLAENLCIQGKKKATRDGKEDYQNWVGYEVLESFDVSGTDLDQWRSQRLGPLPAGDAASPLQGDPLLILGENMKEIAGRVAAIRNDVKAGHSKLSRRQVERLVRHMYLVPQDQAKFRKRIDEAIEAHKDLTALTSVIPDRRAALFHLAALWDYIQGS